MEDPVAAQPRRFYTSCCFAVDKHMANFVVRSMFGFALAMFCAGGLLYEMSHENPATEFITMYFSLLSFVAGYFLGASPRLKRAHKTPSMHGAGSSGSGSDTSMDSAV